MLSKDFNAVLINHGYGFTGEQMSSTTLQSGGHPNSRSIIDELQSNAISRFYRQVS